MAGEPLLRGVSFKLERRERLTIAGRNGAGKTTLLRMLSGETSVDGGELVLRQGRARRPARPAPAARARRSRCASTCSPAAASRSSSRRSSGASRRRWPAGDEAALNRYADVYARFEAAGGYGWRERARSVVHGLGFADADLDRALRTFSGGQLTRASLARALAAQPDLLLLDEPTNHLDIESLEWLEETLLALDAAVILVAHDRWFLETVGTAVLELEAGRARFFNGTWHHWRREQAAREMALGKAIEKQRAEIARMERFIERFRYKATKARQAQSRVKKLDKIERITRDPKDGRALAFSFKPPERSGRVIFELEDGRLEVPAGSSSTTPSCGSSAASTSRSSGRTGPARRRCIEALAGRRELDGGKLRTRPQRQGRLPQPAHRGARQGRRADGARGLPEAHRPAAESGARAARALPVQRRGGREAARRPERRRAPAAVAGDPRVVGRERPDPRRADEPPRPRVARGARGRAALLPGLAAARHPRPRAARRGRDAHGRDRGRAG